MFVENLWIIREFFGVLSQNGSLSNIGGWKYSFSIANSLYYKELAYIYLSGIKGLCFQKNYGIPFPLFAIVI
jgi:hypothetical protein